MTNQWLLSLVLAASVSVVAACGSEPGEGAAPSAPAEAGQDASAGAKPDLSGLPEVVADVNGAQISREEFSRVYESQFQQLAMQAQMSGGKIDQDQLKKQTAENLVGTELLIQEAGKRGLGVSKAEISRTLDDVARENQMASGKEFMAALQAQGMDRAEITSQLRTQVRVEKLVAEEAGTLQVTDREIRAAYRQFADQQKKAAGSGGKDPGGEGAGAKAGVPTLKEARPQIVEYLKSREEAKTAQELIGELRKAADVTINL